MMPISPLRNTTRLIEVQPRKPSGGHDRTPTCNLSRARRLLSQLSYVPLQILVYYFLYEMYEFLPWGQD